MKTVFLDDKYMCHVVNNGTYQAVNTNAFDGMFPELIECYRYVTEGQTYVDEKGKIIQGLYISPAVSPVVFNSIFRQHEIDTEYHYMSLDIPQEQGMTARQNYVEGEFFAVQGQLYKCIYPIPATCTITPGTNVAPATMEEYLESIKEG